MQAPRTPGRPYKWRSSALKRRRRAASPAPEHCVPLRGLSYFYIRHFAVNSPRALSGSTRSSHSSPPGTPVARVPIAATPPLRHPRPPHMYLAAADRAASLRATHYTPHTLYGPFSFFLFFFIFHPFAHQIREIRTYYVPSLFFFNEKTPRLRCLCSDSQGSIGFYIGFLHPSFFILKTQLISPIDVRFFTIFGGSVGFFFRV